MVEDDPALAATLDRVLTAEGHDVEAAADGNDALRRAQRRTFDLVVLDVLLPGLDGIAVCRRLRASGSTPILMLTALSGTEERVRALLRRTTPTDHLRFGDLRLEPARREAWRGDRALDLTATEFELLQHFMRHPRHVLSREQLIDAVWKGEADTDNVVAVYVGYLRQKLGEPRLLHTVRGAGYSLHE